MTEAWLASDGDIKSVMKAMIGSSEFWAEAFNAGRKAEDAVRVRDQLHPRHRRRGHLGAPAG